LNVDEAKELLLKRLEDECEHEMSALIQRKVEAANEIARIKAGRLSTLLSSVTPPNKPARHRFQPLKSQHDMKGRYHRKRSRNMSARFEKPTGVDVIVDDTPE